MNEFTNLKAQEYAEQGNIEAWIHDYLRNEGNNIPLSDGLKLRKRYWLGPLEVKLTSLKRIVGPEPYNEYVESEENWNRRVEAIALRLQQGWDMPPLIIENQGGVLGVRDGNHRMGALEKSGRKSCSVLIWDDAGVEHIRIGDAEE